MAGKQNSKIPRSQVAAIVVLATTIAIAGLYYTGFFDEFMTVNQSPLTPARNLEGTWKTTFATKFNIQVDGNEVGYENRSMTWVITQTSDENIVNVEVTFTYSNRQLVPNSGYTPDVSPMLLRGTIEGTRLTLESTASYYDVPIGEFTFTTDFIEGTWHDHWEMLYDQNVYTATNGLKLIRQ